MPNFLFLQYRYKVIVVLNIMMNSPKVIPYLIQIALDILETSTNLFSITEIGLSLNCAFELQSLLSQ